MWLFKVTKTDIAAILLIALCVVETIDYLLFQAFINQAPVFAHTFVLVPNTFALTAISTWFFILIVSFFIAYLLTRILYVLPKKVGQQLRFIKPTLGKVLPTIIVYLILYLFSFIPSIQMVDLFLATPAFLLNSLYANSVTPATYSVVIGLLGDISIFISEILELYIFFCIIVYLIALMRRKPSTDR